MEPSYADYVEWDEARRKRFPNARHWIYKSFIGVFSVAEWDPISGFSRINVRQESI